MKRKNVIFLVAALLTITMAGTAFAGTWNQDSFGWWYQNDDGGYPAGKWQQINGYWYYFNASGYMAAGQWVGNYYVGSNGAMLTNTTTPDGYTVGSDGAWIQTLTDSSQKSVKWNGHKYVRFDKGLSWEEAEEYCEGQNGHLATITSSAEEKVIRNLISDGTKNAYWLGAQKEDDEWEWVDGEDWDYTNWADSQPDCYRGIEEYLEMYRIRNPHSGSQGLGFWNDIDEENHISDEEDFFTTEQVGFVCELD